MKTHPCALLGGLFVALGSHAAEAFTYSCDNGENLAIRFAESADGRPQAIIQRPSGDIILAQVIAASGARYRAGPLELHTKGDNAFFDDGERQLLCTRGTPPPTPAPPAAASSFITLTGSVAYRTRNALPPDAILTIRVHDAARAGAPARVLAEQRYELNGAQVPIPFTATIDKDLVGKRARVQVAARIEIAGKLRYINDRPYPALKDGQPLPLNIQLKPVTRSKGD